MPNGNTDEAAAIVSGATEEGAPRGPGADGPA
jgi:hypothetical protein